MIIISIDDVYKRVPEARMMSIVEELSDCLYRQSQYLLMESERLKQEIYKVLDKYVTDVT